MFWAGWPSNKAPKPAIPAGQYRNPEDASGRVSDLIYQDSSRHHRVLAPFQMSTSAVLIKSPLEGSLGVEAPLDRHAKHSTGYSGAP